METENKAVFTSKADCEICTQTVTAIDLEKVLTPQGNFWACDDCRVDLRAKLKDRALNRQNQKDIK